MSDGRIGPIQATDGARESQRLARDGSTVTKDELIDAGLRGEVFYGSVAVGGVDHQASFTTTAPAALYNPAGSGFDLEIVAVSMGYVSGTLGAGFLGLGKYCESATNAAPTGTQMVARGSTKFSAGVGDIPGVPLETVTLTAGATLVAHVMDIAPKLATTAIDTAPKIVPLPFPVVVQPGTAAVLSGVCGAAGTTPRVSMAFFWKAHKRAA